MLNLKTLGPPYPDELHRNQPNRSALFWLHLLQPTCARSKSPLHPRNYNTSAPTLNRHRCHVSLTTRKSIATAELDPSHMAPAKAPFGNIFVTQCIPLCAPAIPPAHIPTPEEVVAEDTEWNILANALNNLTNQVAQGLALITGQMQGLTGIVQDMQQQM
ncbi:unnamed protein product [Cuscuta epithymum]|uniref:Uncharacterized protein n=1 Tax=Cuscuta epithymum TaxID=186058 RepID=A0AAV0D7S5_9ASTE|nr:unnamed protein product [Cuscuta epithymum]